VEVEEQDLMIAWDDEWRMHKERAALARELKELNGTFVHDRPTFDPKGHSPKEVERLTELRDNIIAMDRWIQMKHEQVEYQQRHLEQSKAANP